MTIDDFLEMKMDRSVSSPLATFKGLSAFVLLALAQPSWSAFTSGSTGADGALSVPASQTVIVTLPADGILNYTTVSVGAGATLRFQKNSDNTPVTILATGDVTIAGVIDVSGQTAPNTDGVSAMSTLPGVGGPGGYSGGYGGVPTVDANTSKGGNGLGPGGGRFNATIDGNTTGGGGYGIPGGGTANVAGVAYGNASLMPLIGGSGGAGGRAVGYAGGGGGGGGGAILIATNGKILISSGGVIRANGGTGGYIGFYTTAASSGPWAISGAGGSGGAIHLIATEVSGAGGLEAKGAVAGGGNCTYSVWTGHGSFSNVCRAGQAGGYGRILVETASLALTGSGSPAIVQRPLPSSPPLTVLPSIRIVKVQNADVPANPNGVADLNLPSTTANPVAVKIATQGVPSGVKVILTAVPLRGDVKTATSDPIVADAGGKGEVTVNINIDPDQNTLFAITSGN